MRDTLLLVLACVGGSVLISVACAGMWIAGNACVDWYDRIVASRRRVAAIEQADRAWSGGGTNGTGTFSFFDKPLHPLNHTVCLYGSLDAFHADVNREVLSRRAGARGESDG